MFKRGTRYPQLVDVLVGQEDEAALTGSIEDLQPFWAMVDVRTKALLSQKFSNYTVLDLQRTSGSLPSSYACMSALSTIEQYLKTFINAPVDDSEFRSRLVDKLGRVQKLAQGQRDPLTRRGVHSQLVRE